MLRQRAGFHNLKNPHTTFSNTSHGKVLTSETVPVYTDEDVVRVKPGRAKCKLCNREFDNTQRARQLHVNGEMHQEALRVRQIGKKA
jgi:hypothetical protein